MQVYNGAKPSHEPVLFKNIQNSQWKIIVLGKQCGKSSLISMTSNVEVLTLKRKSVVVSIMKLSVFILFIFKQMKEYNL
jgi:hypothetical protein